MPIYAALILPDAHELPPWQRRTSSSASNLPLNPNANERRKKREAIQGSPSDPVGREQQPQRGSALKTVAPFALGAGDNTDNPGRPAENEAVYRNSISGGVHKCLPQLQVLNLRVGKPN